MLRIPSFAVIGGGVDGVAVVRRLLRAVGARRLSTGRILVIDRSPVCPAAGLVRPPDAGAVGSAEAARAPDGVRVGLEVAEWSEWLAANLDRLEPGAHLVPYHWAPHLLLHWLEGEAARAGAATSRGEPLAPRGLPYEAATGGGDRALSYASWPCPPACIEPALCPHTRGPRDWSLAADLAGARAGEAFDERIVFRCLHLVWGVGTIPVADVLEARDRLLAARGRRRVLVATSSHCHALATTLEVGDPACGAGVVVRA